VAGGSNFYLSIVSTPQAKNTQQNTYVEVSFADEKKTITEVSFANEYQKSCH
jgi:hypothetical protein